MKKIKFTAMLMMAFLACASFTACSDDDDEQGGSGSSNSFSLVGRAFSWHYSGVDGDGNREEETVTITFVNSTQCNVNTKGYDYIWDGGYKREYWNETKSCRYSVSGTTITLHDYPFYVFGGDKKYTYKGSYLLDGNDIYTEIE